VSLAVRARGVRVTVGEEASGRSAAKDRGDATWRRSPGDVRDRLDGWIRRGWRDFILTRLA
jgi:hypothetical protein